LGGGQMQCEVCVYTGEALARYGFPGGHPFGVDRHGAFVAHLAERGLAGNVCHREPVMAARAVIERFHTAAYVDFVMQRAARGGYFDHGDTPAFPGAYEAAACVVGTSVAAATAIMTGACRRAFGPIAGLHHARRDAAAGFCVFNDCGVVIETPRAEHGLARIAYVDIDAHHGDGVFYAFEDDPAIFIADIHEDGRSLYPGTGAREETGTGAARGTKLNIPLRAGAADDAFFTAWGEVEEGLRRFRPEFIILQCGADSIADDPLAHLLYTPTAHGHAAARLAELADEMCAGRLLALGGGGYDRSNLGRASGVGGGGFVRRNARRAWSAGVGGWRAGG